MLFIKKLEEDGYPLQVTDSQKKFLDITDEVAMAMQIDMVSD